MDTFFATKKSAKSTRGNTFFQLFVADKSFVHVEPLRKRSELVHVLKSFAKKLESQKKSFQTVHLKKIVQKLIHL